ncbi:MAG: dihydrofolate synthase [Acidimicrobiia bacterium]|nr:dihydrofolate synthase [Acidimicrobiia bacterium]
MTYEEAVAYLDYHAGRGIRPGLTQIQGLLELMGDPHLTYPVVHVTGSKGKSSTSQMITMLAAAHGLSVGTYTSPHLERVEERLAYNGLAATTDEFAQAVADTEAFDALIDGDPERRLTYFEFVTAVALAWFAERAIDLGVIEVGLGGRLDATNVVQSQVAVVASIALEHTKYLGDTLTEIATEKAAILKPGGSLVTGDLPPEAAAVMEARAAELATPYLVSGRDFRLGDEIQAVGGWDISIDGVYEEYDEIHIPVHGRHQLQNAAVAVAATEELLGRALDPEAVQEGFAALTLPGRIEVTGRRPLVVLDGAHTPESMAAGAAALDEEFPPFLWKVVLGALGDKKLEELIGALAPVAGEIFGVTAPSERGIAAADVAAAARATMPDREVHESGSVADGVRAALGAAGEDGAVLVTGSMYVVGEARSLLAEIDRSQNGS